MVSDDGRREIDMELSWPIVVGLRAFKRSPKEGECCSAFVFVCTATLTSCIGSKDCLKVESTVSSDCLL